MGKRLYLVFTMNVISVILAIANLANPTWITVLGDTFGLVTCQNCKPLKNHWSLECYYRYNCKHDYPNCDLFSSLYSSSTLFILLETIHVLFALLIINKLLLIILNRAYGSYSVFITILIISFSLKLSASLSYFVSLSYNKDRLSFESGSNMNIFLIAFSFLTSGLTFFATFNQPEAKNYFCEDFVFYKLKKKAWMTISSVMLILGAYFNVISLSGVYWVNEGTLHRCEYCKEIPWMPWQCLAEYICEINEDSEQCKEYNQLSDAGKNYTIFSVISTILVILVIDTNLACLASNIYGLFRMCIAYLSVSIVFQAFGVINWVAATGNQVEFFCIDENCKGNGPFFAIFGFLFIFIGSIVFLVSIPGVYSNNFEEVQQEEIYKDIDAICNTPISCLDENFDNFFPLSKSFSLLGVKLPSLEDFEHAHSTGF